MSAFNKRSSAAVAAKTAFGPIRTTGPATTFEGGAAFKRDAKSDLFMLSVTYMGADAFYESKDAQAKRLVELTRKVAVEDPDWLLRFIPWLRGEAHMRTASIVIAAEAVKARLAKPSARAPIVTAAMAVGVNRKLIDAACQRADEPGELIAYWHSKYGKALPKPVKRGLGDAVGRLYNEYSLAKYDADTKALRFGDVIDLVHPPISHAVPEDVVTQQEREGYLKRKVGWKGDLYEHALDRRHNRDKEIPASLEMLRKREELLSLPVAERRKVVLSSDGPERLKAAGITWEALSGWLQSPMDKAAWEAVIPSMGYMALLRNLRNFDQAGVGKKSRQYVIDKLSDPAEVAKSKQFPYRFLSAHRAVQSLAWGQALEEALGHACANIPDMHGRTLVLVDTSGSMGTHVSDKSTVSYADIGALIGVAIARKCGPENVDLVGFADGTFVHGIHRGGSLLRDIEAFCARIGEVGHGTQTVAALKAAYIGQERVVLVSDMQSFHHSTWGMLTRGTSVSDAVPANVPMFSLNVAGYAATGVDTSKPHRYEVGGFSDKVFTMLASLSSGEGGWPF